MHKFNGTMGFQRLIKELKRDSGGGGPPGLDSVSSSTIVNGAILGEDLADGTITEEKFSSEFQTNLLEFGRRLINLEQPGWYGTFTIKNNNASNPYSFTFQIYFDTYNFVTDSIDTIQQGDPVTLNHNQHYDLVIPINGRLTNKDTIIRLAYSTSGGDITNTNVVGIGIDNIEEGEIFIVVSKAYIHNGNIELEVIITN